MGRVSLRIPEPNPKQKLFLADHHKYLAFGGARGGGKSWSVRVKSVLLAMRWKGIIIMIIFIISENFITFINNLFFFDYSMGMSINNYIKSISIFN